MGRPNDQVPLLTGKDSANATRESNPKTAIRILNFAAIMASCIALRDRDSKAIYMKLLVADATCCWITGKFNIARRRGIVQDTLQWSQLATDITTVFASHSIMFMLITSESTETIAARALRCIVWFLPLATIAIALSFIPGIDGEVGYCG